MNEELEQMQGGHFGHELHGKRVLLIGSGADIDGRAMGAAIDSEARAGFDLIARVNKGYGTPEDVGSRADILFSCRRAWVNMWWYRTKKFHRAEGTQPMIVAFRDGVGVDRIFEQETATAAGVAKASTGLNAARWLVEHGASVTVIGYGFKDGSFAEQKTYAVTGEVDANERYDWPAENEWLRQHVTLI